MQIREFSQHTGVSAKTIRFYEAIGLLPRPPRGANNYRQFSPADVQRLRFIAAARALGFSLKDVAEFLTARADHQLPCQRVLDSVDARIVELDRRIADMIALRGALVEIQEHAKQLPKAEPPQEECVCDLLAPDGKIERFENQEEETEC